MQVAHADVDHRAVLCNGTTFTSIFFKIDDNTTDTGFFDWQADATAGKDVSINLDKLTPKSTAMYSDITGYYGTDSMPPCDIFSCWYLLKRPLTISTAAFNFFKVNGVAFNNRQLDLTPSYKAATYTLAPFGPLV